MSEFQVRPVQPADKDEWRNFNERGRAFYDRYTDGPSDFIMYQWTLANRP